MPHGRPEIVLVMVRGQDVHVLAQRRHNFMIARDLDRAVSTEPLDHKTARVIVEDGLVATLPLELRLRRRSTRTQRTIKSTSRTSSRA